MLPLSPRKMLVPLDTTEASLGAVRQLGHLVGEECEVHVLHVLRSLHPGHPSVLANRVDEEDRARHVSDWLRQHLADAGLASATVHVQPRRRGSVGGQISRFADQVEADLILVPSPHRSWLGRLLSTSKRVVARSRRPVLVLRT